MFLCRVEVIPSSLSNPESSGYAPPPQITSVIQEGNAVDSRCNPVESVLSGSATAARAGTDTYLLSRSVIPPTTCRKPAVLRLRVHYGAYTGKGTKNRALSATYTNVLY
jgi:hypothetical protein